MSNKNNRNNKINNTDVEEIKAEESEVVEATEDKEDTNKVEVSSVYGEMKGNKTSDIDNQIKALEEENKELEIKMNDCFDQVKLGIYNSKLVSNAKTIRKLKSSKNDKGIKIITPEAGKGVDVKDRRVNTSNLVSIKLTSN